ncbi:MAG TPA: mucoidy inhibitor MuiA family protein [Holophagaceae bacterium]|nr:mucoidy inhibitor MuiA family protein [Holophagaceae bacterium]
MRTLWLLPCLTLTLAAQDAVPVQAFISSVKLYPDEAWVTRIGRARVDEGGTHRLQIADLPASLTLDDVQVSAKGPGGSRLGDVTVSQDTRTISETPEWKKLQADRETLQDKADGLQSQSDAVRQEIAFLEDIRAAQGKELGARMTTAVPNLGPVVVFGQGLQARLAQLLLQERKLKRDLAKTSDEQKRLDAEQNRLSGQNRVAPSKIMVELTTPNAGPVEVQLSYRTRKARWSPVYEARLSEDHARLDLSLFAAVTQKSGEDWRGVRLEISNAKPSQSLDMPAYGGAQEVGWTVPVPPPPAAPAMRMDMEAMASVPKGRDMTSVAYFAPGVTTDSIGEASSESASLQEASGLNLTLRLDGAKDVPSDGDSHRFKLMDQSVMPTLALVTSPRLDAAVYQVARFQTPGTLPIFPGAQMVQYAGAQRLGQSPLAQPTAGQPYQLGFGPYRGLRVSFRRVDHKQETVGAFSKERQWTLRDRMEVASEIAAPVNIEVEDRLLKSTIESVKITDLPDTTAGAKESVPGVRTWTLHLEPGQTTGVTVATQVRAPLNGILTGLGGEQ